MSFRVPDWASIAKVVLSRLGSCILVPRSSFTIDQSVFLGFRNSLFTTDSVKFNPWPLCSRQIRRGFGMLPFNLTKLYVFSRKCSLTSNRKQKYMLLSLYYHVSLTFYNQRLCSLTIDFSKKVSPLHAKHFSAPNLAHSLVRAVQSEHLIPQTGIESIFFACSVKDVEEDINKCPAAPSPVHASVGRSIA